MPDNSQGSYIDNNKIDIDCLACLMQEISKRINKMNTYEILGKE